MDSQDDPRLTRYALGEMTDDADRGAFEATMTDADRVEADAIRTLAGTLSDALSLRRTGIPACLNPAGEADLQREGTATRAAVRQAGMPVLRMRTRWLLAAAASIAVVGLTASLWSTRGDQPTPVAMNLRQVRQASLIDSNENRDALNLAGKSSAAPGSLPRPTIMIQREVESANFPLLEADPQVSAGPRASVASPDQQQQQRATRLRTPASPAAAQGAGGARAKLKDESYYLFASKKLTADDDSRLIRSRGEGSAESYAPIVENPFLDPRSTPVSTFGVDVDTASYANVRRMLTSGQRPPADAVRIEELINYFPTSDAPPTDGKPFAVHADVARCPWNASHDLVRVALKAREVDVKHRPASNLVFLIDVSGSMNEPDKLPLVKRGLERLVDQLNENDRVAIVVYAGNSGLALPSTNAADKATIRAAIDHLEAGGSTNGGQGIELAYATAAANFVRGGANRVILCTDGDFNVGVTDRGSLVSLIQDKAKSGTFLSVLGFGTGNVKDDTMESLADKGNGNYAYLDTDREAEKVLVSQASGTLVTVAKDVKIQIEFNPATVRSYRLIGYENRLLAREDFQNDLKDAGEIGAGHNVVALYEIERTGRARAGGPDVDKLKYQPEPASTSAPADGELLTLKLRYKAPDAPLEQGTSQLIERPLRADDRSIEQASADFQFDAAVAGFGMMLRNSSARGDCDWNTIARLARAGLNPDVGGHRAEFLTLVDRAAAMGQ